MARKNKKALAEELEEIALKDSVGTGISLVFEKTHTNGEEVYSTFDLLLRQQAKLALEGQLDALKFMMRLLDKNLKAREEGGDHRGLYRHNPEPEKPVRSADLALLILGICAVDNDQMKMLERHDGERPEYYDTVLRGVSPTRIAKWVLDYAHEQPKPSPRLDAEVSKAQDIAFEDGDEYVQTWILNRPQILLELMRVNGAGSTCFKPGRSGNRRGRPVRSKNVVVEYPYDGFFMSPKIIRIRGVERTMTWLDALIYMASVKGAKGDRGITKLLLPRLMRLHELNWEETRFGSAVIIRG